VGYESSTALVDYVPHIVSAEALRTVIRETGYAVDHEEVFQTISTRGGRRWVQAFIDHVNEDRCTGCGRCVRACGQGVYALVSTANGKKAQVVNGDNCLGDCHCHKACRFGALVCMPRRLVAS